MAGLVFAERGIIGPGVGRMEHVKVRACADTQYSTLPDIDRKLLNASPLDWPLARRPVQRSIL